MKFKIEASEAGGQYIWLTIDSIEKCLELYELRELNTAIENFLEVLEDRAIKII